jgi:hyperosmotically inducible protein
MTPLYLSTPTQDVNRRKMKQLLFFFVLILFSMETMGCALSPKNTSQRVIQDTNITTKVKTKLANDSALNLFKIDVDTQQGIVTLTGNVPTEDRKRRASDLTTSVDGVRMVENFLQVGAKKKNVMFEDAVITSKITSGLIRNPSTHALTIDVETSKGEVVLTGQVQSEAEKKTAEQIARTTSGVVSVENQLKVTVD